MDDRIDEALRIGREDSETEQSILAVQHRLNSVYMSSGWAGLLGSIISSQDGSDAPMDVTVRRAWPVVVNAALRFMMGYETVTGMGARLDDVADWVRSFAHDNGVDELSDAEARERAHELVVKGFMADGARPTSFRYVGGRLVPAPAPLIVESAGGGRYTVTPEALDYAYRNVEYERNYGKRFDYEATRALEATKNRNYTLVERNLREMLRVIDSVKRDYTRVLSDGLSVASPEGFEKFLLDLGEQMGTAFQQDILLRIRRELRVALDFTSMAGDDIEELAQAREKALVLNSFVNRAIEGLKELIGLRGKAHEVIQERARAAAVVRNIGSQMDFRRLMERARTVEGGMSSLLAATALRVARPARPASMFSVVTLLDALSVANCAEDDPGLPMDEVSVTDDVLYGRPVMAFFGFCEHLLSCLGKPEDGSRARVSLSDVIASAPEDELFEWIDCQSIRLFVHRLHVDGGIDFSLVPDDTSIMDANFASWISWRGERPWFSSVSYEFTGDGMTMLDAQSADGRRVATFAFEGMEVVAW